MSGFQKFLVVLLVSVGLSLSLHSAAEAADSEGWVPCGAPSAETSTATVIANLVQGTCFERRFTSGATAVTNVFRCRSTACRMQFDDDIATDASAPLSTHTISVQMCPFSGLRTANTCADVADSLFDGTEGANGTQKRTIVVGFGVYLVTIVAKPVAATAMIEVMGVE